jgi:hypothetical protein
MKVGLAVVFAAANSFVFAQAYTILPSDSIVTYAPFNTLSHFTIQQKNNYSKTIVLSWQQIFLHIPNGWIANLCDNGHCYADFPISGTMDSVYNMEYGLMAIGINPDTIKGTAIIKYAVWDVNTPTKKDTLTWIISASSLAGIVEIEHKNTINIFPNPVKNNLNIISNLQTGFTYSINNLSGKEILTGHTTSNSISLSTENVSDGIYSISVSENKKIISTKKIIIQH